MMGTGRPVAGVIESGETDAIDLYRSLAQRFPKFTVVPLPPPPDMSDVIRFAAGTVVRDGYQRLLQPRMSLRSQKRPSLLKNCRVVDSGAFLSLPHDLVRGEILLKSG